MKTPAAPYIAAFLLLPALAGLLAIPLAGCDSYNLSFKEFYEGEGESDPSAKAITGFRITSPVTAAGTVNDTLKTIAVMVSSGTPVTNMVTAITHTGVSVYPPSGTAQDFTYPVPYTVTAADGSTQAYTVTVFPLVLLADITAYISGYTGPNPVPLAVDITLSAGGWTGLLNAIAAANPFRPVALDLSACDAGTHSAGGGFYSDGTFDPDNTNLSIAKSYIVSLVLPNAAEKIAAGSGTSSTFQNFTNLEAVSGAGITTIGGNAFMNCTALTAITPANFPAATSIGASAFQNCADLTSVSLPAAASIGSSAFQNCGDLTTVSLPEAASIGSSAFYYCTDLSSAYLPKAASIGASAFLYCVALSSLTLPATPPGLGTNVFQGTGGGTSPGIVIHVPAGAVSGYETGWGVAAVTAANGNPTKYGAGHNAVSITTP